MIQSSWVTIDLDAAFPPTILRRGMLAVTGLTGLVASLALGVIVLTALFGGEGESAQHGLFRNGVFLGGIGLLAVSGAVIVFAELDDAPGGVLAGLLLATQGGAAVLAVALPQLTTARPSRA